MDRAALRAGLENLPIRAVVLLHPEEAGEAASLIRHGAHDYLIHDTSGAYLKLLPHLLDRLYEVDVDPEVFSGSGLLDALSSAFPAPVLVIRNHRIVAANPTFLRLSGYADEALRGQPDSLLFTRDYGTHFHQSTAALMEGGANRTTHFETGLIHANGTALTCEITAGCHEVEGVRYLVLVVSDRTLDHETRDELEETVVELRRLIRDRMAQVDDLRRSSGLWRERARKTEMATSVLHNVKNVLTSLVVGTNQIGHLVDDAKIDKVVQVARLLEENTEDLATFFSQTEQGRMLPRFLSRVAEVMERDREKLAGEVDRLIRNIEHINVSIQGQLHAARLEETLAVRGLLEEATGICRETLNGGDIRIVYRVADEARIVSDRHKLLQILVNLITNAAQAIVERGLPGEIVLGFETGADTAAFRVEDNGIGMTAATREKLFGFGFTTREKGHGFGLHGCRLLAQSLGGRLEAESEGLGLGALFRLSLPVVNPVGRVETGVAAP